MKFIQVVSFAVALTLSSSMVNAQTLTRQENALLFHKFLQLSLHCYALANQYGAAGNNLLQLFYNGAGSVSKAQALRAERVQAAEEVNLCEWGAPLPANVRNATRYWPYGLYRWGN
jgi:hypothetical protein